MKRLAMLPLVGLLAAAACTVDKPTAPFSELAAPGPGISASIGGGAGTFSAQALEHLSTRVVGAFTDEAAAAEVRAYLRDLDAALVTGDSGAAHAAIQLARQVVDPNGDGSSITVADAADVGVILLVLEQVEQTID